MKSTEKEQSFEISPQQILMDFRLTFLFSQNNVDPLQKNLFKWVALYYLLFKREFTNSLQAAEKSVLKLRPPEQHANVSAQRAAEEFHVRWKDFLEIIKEIKTTHSARRYRRIRKEVIYDIISGLILVDLKYQIEKRPKRGWGEDKYESFLRTYTVLKKQTGSATFDDLFRVIRRFVTRACALPNPQGLTESKVDLLRHSIRELSIFWQTKHRKEDFIPPQ